MGLRGKLPSVQAITQTLLNIDAPEWLTPEGKAYWLRHASHLQQNKLLTVETQDAFALHCDLWSRLRSIVNEGTTRTYLDCYSRYQSSAKVFRLLPVDKPGIELPRHYDKPEFEMDDNG